jgi:hypothetical protein
MQICACRRPPRATRSERTAVPHLPEQLFDVGNPERPLPSPKIIVEYEKLADRDLIGLDGVRLRKKGNHVADEGAGDPGRQFDRLLGMSDYALLWLVVLSGWQIFASERKMQSRRTLVSLCSPERTFFTLKFVELFVGCSREMLARRLRNRFSANHCSVPKSVEPTATGE